MIVLLQDDVECNLLSVCGGSFKKTEVFKKGLLLLTKASSGHGPNFVHSSTFGVRPTQSHIFC